MVAEHELMVMVAEYVVLHKENPTTYNSASIFF
jgi:hypothetical protein